MTLHEIREDDGRLPAYAWPGGYPIIYIVADGEVLCPDCANGENGSEADLDRTDDPGWHLVGFEVYYEGAAEHCAHCNTEMESAYGDPGEEAA
jgi:hypothetical protein